MAIKLVAFELDYTIWTHRLDERSFGKGRGASSVIEDNLQLVDERVIRDKSDDSKYITLFPDVPGIITDIVKRGIKIAVVSRNSSKALCDRALWLYKTHDKYNKFQPIISLVAYDEVNIDSQVKRFEQIKEWSGFEYQDMVLFDSNSPSSEVNQKLGVHFKLVDRSAGLTWRDYTDALGITPHNPTRGDPYDTPFYGQPPLGKHLGSGKFGDVYYAVDDPNAVIKVLKYWVGALRPRFLEIYKILKAGGPFKPSGNKDDEYLLMIAFELRNLDEIHQLKAPKPEQFTGWFTMTKVEGTLLWKTPVYKRHPFSVPYQRLIKTGFHLAVDEIEDAVKKYGIEHRDAHLNNVMFTMNGDQPVKAHLFDWGIAVRMKWDSHDKRYIRGNDLIVWGKSEQGAKYTPEEFRAYWITWMVKTEYEACMKRNQISQEDGQKFLKDLNWWFER